MKTDEKIVPAGGSGGRGWGARGGATDPHAHYTSGRAPEQLVYSSQGHVVGRLTPDGWLEKHVDPARHKLRAPAGWATDVAHLQFVGLHGIRLVLPDGTILTSRIEAWRRHAVPVNRGFGEQMCLPDEFWVTHRPGEPAMEQLSLWGCL